MQTLYFLLLLLSTAVAQQLFPGIQGEALLDSLVVNYKPAVVLDYNGARDKMYALIDNRRDSVTCVYTGYQVYIPYNYPTPRDLTNNAIPKMDTEHSWPKSKGAETSSEPNAISDLHHLYPTNSLANSARGSLPFGNVPDQEANRWWFGASYITSIPISNKELYSREKINVRFEPRDVHKGDLARSMFYFYAMYKAAADAADPNFFNIQKDALYTWHKIDPADERELERTNMIAGFQDERPNPFVIDSTLVRRCYFSVNSLHPATDAGYSSGSYELFQNYPNPFNSTTRVEFMLKHPSRVRLEIHNIRGLRIEILIDEVMNAGMHQISWKAGPEISSGIYFYQVHIVDPGHTVLTKKMILVK